MKMICNQTNCPSKGFCTHATEHDDLPGLCEVTCGNYPKCGHFTCKPVAPQTSFWVLQDSLTSEDEEGAYIGLRKVGKPVRVPFLRALRFKTQAEVFSFINENDIRASFYPAQKTTPTVLFGVIPKSVPCEIFDSLTSGDFPPSFFPVEEREAPQKEILKTLDEHNKEVEEQLRLIDHGQRKFLNGLECPECGAELWDTSLGTALMSNPAKKRIHCEASECSYTGTCLA